MRSCTACGEAKEEAAFPPPKPSNRMRPQRRCRECCNRKERERRSSSDRHAAYLREYRAEHRDCRRRWNLWSKYRITPDDYDNMLAAQGGVCAICTGPQDRVSKDGSYWFDVDHDHRTGKVRGLLCHSCNTGIGKLKDDISVLERAAGYLRRSVVEDIGST